MKSQRIEGGAGAGAARTWVLVFDAGDAVMSSLERFARDEGLDASRISAIGAFECATLGYFDRRRRDYDRIAVDEQVEVLSLLGDIATNGDEPVVHLHAVLGRRDGSTIGGHLIEARVWPTLEVMLEEAPAHLRRRHDAASGLALIDLGGTARAP